MAERLRGLIAPPFSPMLPDGRVNTAAVEKYADMLAEDGVSGAFVCGSTGEHVSLTIEERMQLAERWVGAAADRLTVIIHVGHHSLPECRRLAEHAQRIGADAVAAFPPTVFKPRYLDDLVEFCAQVAAAAPKLPFYYYHIPVLTGVQFPMAEFLRRGSERIATLRGVKFSSRDLVDLGDCLELDGGRFDVPFGWDEMLLAALALGARAAIGTTYNFAAPLYGRLIAAFEAGDLAAARAEQARSRLLSSVALAPYGLAGVKAVMGVIGLDCGPVRLPLRALTDEETGRLKAELDRIGFFDWAR
jgi:N-acetylneuraminate lyase